MVKKGEWVRIHSVVLKSEERTAKIPEDTKATDFEMWTKGTLLEDAKVGDVVKVKTAANRIAEGTLVEVNPYYPHSYGKFVPEIIEMDKQLKEAAFGGGK